MENKSIRHNINRHSPSKSGWKRKNEMRNNANSIAKKFGGYIDTSIYKKTSLGLELIGASAAIKEKQSSASTYSKLRDLHSKYFDVHKKLKQL